MLQITECVKHINHFEKGLIQTVVPRPEFFLTLVCLDDKESGLCLCLIVDWPSCLIYVKADQIGW